MRELRVLLRFAETDVRAVGTLVEDGPRVWFEYDASFAAHNIEISPMAAGASRRAST